MHGDSAERFYLRPENSRVNDQLYRNRSTQYESDPEFPWQRLRRESPGVYESYVDVESGAWTTLRIEVTGAAGGVEIYTPILYYAPLAERSSVAMSLDDEDEGGFERRDGRALGPAPLSWPAPDLARR